MNVSSPCPARIIARPVPRHARRVGVLAIAALGLQLVVVARAQALSNGDFSSGLDGWSTSGPVSVDSGELLLVDDGPASSAAWQAVEATSGRARVEFELLAEPSGFTPSDPFGFPDIFAASVYLLDDPVGFDPADGLALSAVSLLSYDADGAFDVLAELTPSSRGGDWLHVSYELDTPNLYLAPAFELFELALVGGDSAVRVDDVVVTSLPEPGTAPLLGLGIGFALARSRKRA